MRDIDGPSKQSEKQSLERQNNSLRSDIFGENQKNNESVDSHEMKFGNEANAYNTPHESPKW